ncbi:MAG: PsbP-related protein [Acidimicrobiales bacterium]
MTDPTDHGPTSAPPADDDEVQVTPAEHNGVEAGTEAGTEPDGAEPVEEAPVGEAADTPVEEAAVEEETAVETPLEAVEDEPPAELPQAAAGDIEWQPVYEGDQISWQPVVSSEGDDAWPTADELVSQWQGQQEQEEQPPPVDYEDAAGADWGIPEADEGEAQDEAALAEPVRPKRGRRPSPQQIKQRRMVVILSVLTGVVLMVLVFAVMFNSSANKNPGDGTSAGGTTPPTTSANTAITLPASEFETFKDDVTGLSIKYPKGWVRTGVPVADVRLTVEGGGGELMRIRVIPIETPATPENLTNFKSVTDVITFTNENNKLVQTQFLQVNGRLAIYYLYTTPDTASGQQSVHAHYFIFEGHRMFSVVLQAVPLDDFQKLAGIYDQMAESFTVPDERTLPTTTAPPTTVP